MPEGSRSAPARHGEAAFLRADVNNDGALSREEFLAYFGQPAAAATLDPLPARVRQYESQGRDRPRSRAPRTPEHRPARARSRTSPEASAPRRAPELRPDWPPDGSRPRSRTSPEVYESRPRSRTSPEVYGLRPWSRASPEVYGSRPWSRASPDVGPSYRATPDLPPDWPSAASRPEPRGTPDLPAPLAAPVAAPSVGLRRTPDAAAGAPSAASLRRTPDASLTSLGFVEDSLRRSGRDGSYEEEVKDATAWRPPRLPPLDLGPSAGAARSSAAGAPLDGDGGAGPDAPPPAKTPPRSTPPPPRSTPPPPRRDRASPYKSPYGDARVNPVDEAPGGRAASPPPRAKPEARPGRRRRRRRCQCGNWPA